MKKIFLLSLFLFMLFFNGLFASLEDDKNALLAKVNYQEETTLGPILNSMYKQALSSYFKNDFETSIYYYKKILEIDENYRDTKFLLEIMEKMTNYPVYEAKGIVISEYLETAKGYYETQHYLAALNIWEKLLVLKPKEIKYIKANINDTRKFLADPYYERGWVFYNKEDYDAAIDEWENVLALVSDYYLGIDDLIDKAKKLSLNKKLNAIFSDIDLFLKQDKVLDAKVLVDKAISLSPKDEKVKHYKNIVLELMTSLYKKNFNKALKLYNEKNYKEAINYFNLAFKYSLNNKQKAECDKYIISANRILRDTTNKKVKKDEVVYKEPVAEAPKVVDHEMVRKHYTQGLYYYKNGYINKAVTEWEIAISLDPENERVYTSLQKGRNFLNKKAEKAKE